ncbi:MAG: nucleotidyl transferase AbiEii/AbiGii toxin family protein, partial [Anaerolineales bacterium]
QQQGAFLPMAFLGGTALRFLYRINRFSEDLDFSLVGKSESFQLNGYLTRLETDLSVEGYPTEIKVKTDRTVQSAFVRFPGLLYAVGLSQHENEIISIKIEVDTNPPTGAGLEITTIRHYATLRVQHHDQASLLAGKMHAVLQRRFDKGRDMYDLLWYFSDHTWPSPNLVMLNNALAQTRWKGAKLTKDNWRAVLLEKLRTVQWDQIQIDVRPFVERTEMIQLLTLATFENLLNET